MIFEDNLLIKLAMDWSESADFINRSFASILFSTTLGPRLDSEAIRRLEAANAAKNGKLYPGVSQA